MEKKNEYDVIIIGAGVLGSAMAWSLAKDGRQILLIGEFNCELADSFKTNRHLGYCC